MKKHKIGCEAIFRKKTWSNQWQLSTLCISAHWTQFPGCLSQKLLTPELFNPFAFDPDRELLLETSMYGKNIISKKKRGVGMLEGMFACQSPSISVDSIPTAPLDPKCSGRKPRPSAPWRGSLRSPQWLPSPCAWLVINGDYKSELMVINGD